MADTRSSEHSEAEAYAALLNSADRRLNKIRNERDHNSNFDVNNIKQAAVELQHLSKEISIEKQALKDIAKELANTTDEVTKSKLLKQQEDINKILNKNKNALGKIKEAHGDNVESLVKEEAEVRAYAEAISAAAAEEEYRTELAQERLKVQEKENELIRKGKWDEIKGEDGKTPKYSSEKEAKRAYLKNAADIKGEKVKAEFMSDDGIGGKTLNLANKADTLTGGRFGLEEKLGKIMSKFGDGTMAVLNGLRSTFKELSKKLDDAVNDAAKFLSDNYTKIQSDLKGTTKTFDAIQDAASENFGVNRFVLQTDYLSKIADLTDKGLNFNLEERAMIQTVSDKTLHTFDATDATLTRLVRYLGKDITTSQYGLEYTLRNTLNKVFGDSSYLNELYDNVTSAIQDAALLSGEDITPFNSTVQTWLSYMYDYGLSNNVVSRIAEGINYLGTGNVSALASNQDLQRLFLLSMDTAGLNYADILQQGLDAETTNKLLSSVVNYLDEIVNNTEDNLVLQNSYANLFNMSITDMKAIRQLANTDINYLSNYNSASAAAYTSISDLSDDTKMSTQIDNMLSNAQWVYGFDIATNNGKYMAYKISDLILNVTDGYTDVKGAVGTVARAAQLVGTIGKFAVTALGLMSVAKGVFGGGILSPQTSIADNYLNLEPVALQLAEDARAIQNGEKSGHADAEEGSSSSKTLGKSAADHVAEMVGEDKDWTTDDHDVLDILKEFEKTIMKSATSKNYAVAVSLEGLNDDVLTSFASIFADEDAMLKTYEGKNNVIDRSLFNYVDRAGVNGTAEAINENMKKHGLAPAESPSSTETPTS